MQRCVVVTLRVEGVHCWPECPIEEVSFLRDPHRHMFHITATRLVTHNDRDVEIIMLKREIKKYLFGNGVVVDFGRQSCEDIAEDLITKFDLKTCEVLEDGENGAFLFNEDL